MKIILFSVTSTVMSFFLLTCDPACLNRPGGKEYTSLTSINETGNSQLIRSFDDYGVDIRTDIFLYAVTCRQDPRFEPILARGGSKIIPEIVNRIETADRPWDMFQVVNVLIRINDQCKCINDGSAEVSRLEAVAKKLDDDKSVPADDTYKQIYLDKVRWSNLPGHETLDRIGV